MDTSSHRRLLLALAGLLVSTSARGAIDPSSACDAIDATYIQWQQSTTAANTTATAPAHDTSFPGITTPAAYFAQGHQLLKFRNSDGTKLWAWCPPNITGCTSAQGATTINNFPSPVPLSTPALHGCSGTPCESIFLGGADGFLYKVDAATGISSVPADARRKVGGSLICGTAPSDALNATPAVVLYAYADSTMGSRGRAFRDNVDSYSAHVGDDVVIVINADGCGDTTRNRIIAYWAKDLTPKWIFNGDGDVKVDRGTEGCMIDYQSMRLFCGTDLADGASGQSSLFALDVITGQLLWSTNAGAILNRPMLNFNNGRLYVVSKPGSIMAYNPAGDGLGGASRLWSNPLAIAAAGTIISRVPSVESRAGTWQNRILALDSGGTLHAVSDLGSSGKLLWDLGAAGSGSSFKSLPVVLPGGSETKAFIGRSDGYIQMVDLTDDTPIPQGVVTVNAAFTTTFDPSIDLDAMGNPRLVVVSGQTISRLTMPFCLTPPYGNANCTLGGVGSDSCNRPAGNNVYNPCLIQFCCDSIFCGGSDQCLSDNTIQAHAWVPDGTPCDDNWVGSPNQMKGACTSSTLRIPTGLTACTNHSDCWPDHVNNTNDHFCKCPSHPSDLAPCNTPGTGTCTCNSVSGVDCNDACVSGVCTHDTYTGCVCTNPGDVACSADDACCGSLTGGCVNLLNDAAHCGDCFTDCNTYFTPPATSCSADVDCTDPSIEGTPSCGFTATSTGCTTDANCTMVFGSGSKCSGTIGGVCYTGQCRYLTQGGTCSGGVCTNLPACIAPSVTDLQSASQKGVDALAFAHGGTCDAFVTNYRTDLPADGACGAACASDSACGAGNKCAGGSCCPEGKACVSGTCRYANIQEIGSGGIISYFTITGDVSRMHGIGVLRSAVNAFASFVNDPASLGTAGFGLARGSTYTHPATSAASTGAANEPFAATEFDRGPVGPAVDSAVSTDGAWTTYFGNFVGGTCADKDLCKITGGSTANSPLLVNWSNQPCKETLPGDGICLHSPSDPDVSAQRITALAFGQLKFQPPNVFHRYLIVAHGTTLSFLDLDGGSPAQKDIDLTNRNIYDPLTAGAVARGESTPANILAIAIVPDGDLVIEVRGNNANRFLLNVDAHDQSCRHERVVQHDQIGFHPCAAGNVCDASTTCVSGFCLDLCGSCPAHSTCTNIGVSGNCELPAGGGTRNVCCIDNAVPSNLGATDGRLTITPDGQLIRFVPQVNLPATSWKLFQLTK